MNNTYTILDKAHWKVMQLDPDKIYRTSTKYKVFQIGRGIMQDYPIHRKIEDDFWNKILWGTATS